MNTADNILPRINREEMRCIMSHLKSHHTVFEWGPSEDTIRLSQCVNRYYGVEHDFAQYTRISSNKRKNTTVYYIPPSCTPTTEKSHEKYKHYARTIRRMKYKRAQPDILLINGKARVACAIEAYEHIQDDTLVFIGNFNRPDYWNALKYYSLIDTVDTLAILQKKRSAHSQSGNKDRKFLIKKYLLDPLKHAHPPSQTG